MCYSLIILYDVELLRPFLEPKTEEKTKWAIWRDKTMERDLERGL